MRKDEMVVVSTIYILIIVLFMLVIQIKETKREEAAKLEAMSIAIDLNKSNNEYIVAIKSLNNHIDKMQHLDKLVQDLATVPRDKQSLILANCFNESNLKYDVKHKGKFDKTTKGICGVKSEWIEIIPELNEDNINSLEAGYLVINYLEFEALKKYKGSINNLSPVNHTLQLKKAINENN